MANELKHKSQGTTLTQAEYENIDAHVCDSQATGDLIYASSATQLSRLAIGAADTVFTCNGSVPSWSATPILNTAVAKGTWTASGTWTIPAVTLGGNVLTSDDVAIRTGVNANDKYTLEGWDVDGSIYSSVATIQGGVNYPYINLDKANILTSYTTIHTKILLSSGILFATNNGAGGSTTRLTLSESAATTTATWNAVTQIGLILGGNMTVTGYTFVGAIDTNTSFKKSGVQVVGARVIDARCDDAVNSGDATTDGVIDALRDAMITHGLVAAA